MSITDSEVDHQLAALHIRAGSPPDLRQRDRALAWLLQNADRSFPVVLTRAAAQWDDLVLLDLLGRYRRAESTAVLLRAFSDGRARLQAASGLGMSPDPAARAALRTALESAESGEAAAALSGMGASADPSYCVDIAPQLHAENAEVRWMAVEAGTRLACLDKATLESISHSDADPTVRALAADKLRSLLP
jgi:HEAT repeat protein